MILLVRPAPGQGTRVPLGPLLILVLLAVGITALHRGVVSEEDRIQASIDQAEQMLGRPLSDAQVEARLAERSSAARHALLLLLVGALSVVAVVIVAAAFTFAAALLGADAAFGRVFAGVARAMVPPSLGWTACVAALLLLSPAADIEPLRIDRMLVSSAAGLVDPRAWSPFTLSLLSSLDVFSIWTAGSIAQRVGTEEPRLGAGRALRITVTLWAIYAVFRALLAAWLPALA